MRFETVLHVSVGDGLGPEVLRIVRAAELE
jgi:hypothetical protein